jgi:hypothetical protein
MMACCVIYLKNISMEVKKFVQLVWEIVEFDWVRCFGIKN